MGQCLSLLEIQPEGLSDAGAVSNDYELVIRASKELEHVLDTQFGGQGKGLHEKCDSVADRAGFSQELRRKIHYLATIRNKLVHERGFNNIPDRTKFVMNFNTAQREIAAIVQKRSGGKAPQGDFCRVQ